MAERIQLDFNDGKYSVVKMDGVVLALRHGEPWIHFGGNNMICLMVDELAGARALVRQLAAILRDAPKDKTTLAVSISADSVLLLHLEMANLET